MLRLCALVALVTMSAPQAHADWRFTRWGMSPEQVVSASGRIARPVPRSADQDPGPPEEALLETPYEARGVRFMTRFLFDGEDHRLVRVVLSAADAGDCPRLAGLLTGRYGEPSRDDGAEVLRTTVWADARTMDLVTLSRLDAGGTRGCVLSYEPLPGEDAGL
jgi:hypothetical protein